MGKPFSKLYLNTDLQNFEASINSSSDKLIPSTILPISLSNFALLPAPQPTSSIVLEEGGTNFKSSEFPMFSYILFSDLSILFFLNYILNYCPEYS
jgi:hypothetical protein